MRSNTFQTILIRSALAFSVLLPSGAAFAQQQINLTAGFAPTALPDGSLVPMWGYTCGSAVPANPLPSASCFALSGATAGWSPVVITVPTGQVLQINLTNNLSFTTATGTNGIPTSLVIVGQLGGGLGDVTQRTTTPSPDHSNAQANITWPIAGPADVPGTPPVQGARVQSFATEVAPGATTSLTWTGLRPGTYLIESGTHPSIQGPMGLYGILVVTTAPSGGTAGTAYPGVNYAAEVPVLLSEIDPVQNGTVDAAVRTAGFSETRVWSGQPGGCGDPSSSTYQTCYPPAVNYTPLYYLVNGVAFDKTHSARSLFNTAPASGVTGNVLVRLVNAGLRMHVPSVVGSLTTPPIVAAGTAAVPVPGFSLVAEDGNPLPGVSRVQSEVFMAAGKTVDVMVNAPAACTPVPPATTCTTPALAVFDRELSLSANALWRDGGMLAYLSVNGGTVPSTPGAAAATAVPDNYPAWLAGRTITVSDPSKGVIANDVNVYGVALLAAPQKGTVALNKDGTFTYVATGACSSSAYCDSFTYCANGTVDRTVTPATCSSGVSATVTLAPSNVVDPSIGVICSAPAFPSNLATYLAVKTPGVLGGCRDGAGLPLTVAGATAAAPLTVTLSGGPGTGSAVLDANGGFTATVTAAGTYTFTFRPQSSLGTLGAVTTATLTFPTANGPTVTVVDGANKATVITDYRWIIEEDRTFYVDPNCTQNPLPAGCPTVTSQGTPAVFGTNFHTSYMPIVAQGCTGSASCESGQKLLGVEAVCDVGNGACRTSATQLTAVDPSKVHLDPTKRYYISVLPGDAADPFNSGYGGAPDCSPAGVAAGSCGHGMGGAPIAAGQTAVLVLTEPTPNPTAKLSVFVFEDDYPLNGEHDAGGGIDVLAPQEPGLGGFEITLFDQAGGTGDTTGQPTYDMFNMPLTNSLAGTIDPTTGMDACPISKQVTLNAQMAGSVATPDQCAADPNAKGCQKGIVGMIVTCPKYESDGKTLSPLAGHAVVNNLYQGRYDVVATPGADRIARGEEWLQTNTLDGQKAHEAFLRIGEPAYFQEFGPAGYHVSIGFANPKIINDRKADVCASNTSCGNEVKGHVTTARMSRPPDERLYGSGSRDSFAFTQCYVSLGDPEGADFAFAKCDDQGNFDLTGIPAGNWKLTIFDQWNDQIVDGITTPVGLGCSTTEGGICPPGSTTGPATVDMQEVAVHQWQANIYTRTFLDINGASNGLSDKDPSGNDLEPGLPLVSTNIRFRDGSFSNFNNTDLYGYAGFNEVFPLFNWYVIETDSTSYKSTGVHVVYDSGGPTDGTCTNGTCGSSAIGQNMANTFEAISVPANLRVPGAVYCAGADCSGKSVAGGPATSDPPTSGCTTSSSGNVSCTTRLSTGRIDPPIWFGSYGWQGYTGQNSFLEFGKKPFATSENGGIHGHVVYASTRPFDDPQLLLQLSWEPLVPHVRVNLYRESFAADGITPTLTLVDFTDTTSFDDWAQGFRSDGVPNMNCPGQSTSDPFFYSLQNQPQWLNWYNSQHGGASPTPLPNNSQFKCYDGMHNWNQLQPAPYDGIYGFPSVTGIDPATGKPSGTNCTSCVTNPDASDPYRFGGSTTPVTFVPGTSAGTPMLPPGKYVVEVVVPPGYELVKEEDKNILIGDNYIAPAVQQFVGLGNIFIVPDQASVAAAYNRNNPLNPTTDLGVLPRHEGDTGSVESFWKCVGEARVVPDFISLFPGSEEVAPFAGATRNLCDRKEITLTDGMSALAKFYIFTPTHVASHFTGVITDDFTAEFDPFSPQFGEKFAPAYLPVSVKDWAGNEVSRVYSDQFGAYNGLNYSTWEVNPPNPTGYGPTTMVMCMNDPGSGTTADALYQTGYSQFCYHLPFMPGQTGYFDTPVVPTAAFSEGYNHPDCNYPDATPALSSVNGDGVGPWVSAAGHTLTLNALGDQQVDNYGYSGPATTTSPFDQKKITRHYGFGATLGTVTIGGVIAAVTSWSDTAITVTVPTGVPNCALQQQTQYGGSTAQCGQLVITAANGRQSIDTVTVTIGGKAPTRLAAGQTIQSAIDAAAPGDLIIVPAGVYNELVLMWKPVRLQGVGAASSIINANTHPSGPTKLDPWRRQVVCLFGLALNGTPISASNPYDPTGAYTCGSTNGTRWNYFNPFDNAVNNNPQVDRLPLEATVGWDASLNGNLAEQLIEPTLLGAYEGAGITVLSKGVHFPSGSLPFAADIFPAGTTLLTTSNCTSPNPYPSNFLCNPSRIDGLAVTNSSQGGGGIQVHGWGHNVEISNNRVYGNTGSLSGGITVGQGEHPDAYLQGATNPDPGSCETSAVTNQTLPFCFNQNVNIHNNAIRQNSSMGDELFSSTPAGAGGATICNGSDNYRFSYNWVCGNLSTGDGAGIAHIGFTKNGLIEHNQILFNQSTNPTITTNGGGLLVMGAPDVDPTCGGTTDLDCVPDPTTITPGDGTGPGLVINANLIMGNSAESGSGGGLRLQHVNGSDVVNLPNGASACTADLSSCTWNSVKVTNNIIANNVAGWDGGGVSLQDALAVNIVNNTIISNDTTASSGVLLGSLFAPLASAPAQNCVTGNGSQSCPQVAGLVSVTNSAVLQANLQTLAGFSCPSGHGTSGSCGHYSVPLLYNNVIWQNRSFFIGVTPPSGTGSTGLQSIIGLFDAFTTTPVPPQPSTDSAAANGSGQIITGGTGACVNPVSYWDIGVRGDSGPSNHSSGYQLFPTYSVLTDAADYPGANNTGSNPTVLNQYCNGSRVPPEDVCRDAAGIQIPCDWQLVPGTNETNALPRQVFTLSPSATVDEGNNWVNMRFGPLALANPVSNAPLGNYGPAAGSPVINYISSTAATYAIAPSTDFYGSARKTNGAVDAGAVEFAALGAPVLTSISPASGLRGTTVAVTLTGTGLTGATSVNTAGTPNVSATLVAVLDDTTLTATITIGAAATLGPKNVTVTTPRGTSNAVTFTVVGPTLTSISPNSGPRGVATNVTLTGTGLSGATSVNAPANVTVTNFVAVNATTVTATLTPTAAVTLGPKNITVTTPAGTTNPVTFTVLAPATLTSISPSSGARGTSVNVTLTGTGLLGVTSVNAPGSPNISVSNVTVVNDTTVTATLTMQPATALGLHNITVTTAGGNSNAVSFRVTGATLAFSAPVPVLTTTPANTSTKNGVVTVSNTATGANAGPFTLTAAPAIIKTAGPAATVFSITGGTCAAGLMINPGSSCTVNVQYAPGGSTATSTAHVQVTGMGIAAPIPRNGPNFNGN